VRYAATDGLGPMFRLLLHKHGEVDIVGIYGFAII
jgi:hypothetical protein